MPRPVESATCLLSAGARHLFPFRCSSPHDADRRNPPRSPAPPSIERLYGPDNRYILSVAGSFGVLEVAIGLSRLGELVRQTTVALVH